MSKYYQSLVEEILDLYGSGVGVGALNKAFDATIVSRALKTIKPAGNSRRKKSQSQLRRQPAYV